MRPAPRSHGRRRIVTASSTCTRWTLHPTGPKNASMAGPTVAWSMESTSATSMTRCGFPTSTVPLRPGIGPPRSMARPSVSGPGPGTPMSTVAVTSMSSGPPSTTIRRRPDEVSTVNSRALVPVARATACAKQRRPLPLTSAELPSLFRSVNVSPSAEPVQGVPKTRPSAPIPCSRSQSRLARAEASTGTSATSATRKSLPRPW